MAKVLKKLRIGPDFKENDLHGTPDYPCEVYFTDLSKRTAGLLPEHWHNQLEYGLVVKGTLVLKCNGQPVTVSENQGFFINTNVLHSMKLKEGQASYYSVVFRSDFLGFPKQIYRNYVEPFIENPSIPWIVLQDVDWIKRMKRAVRCYEDKKEGYEFDFHQEVAALWKKMYEVYPPARGVEEKRNKRIQGMLRFIEEHYREDIGVYEIARSVGISERECFRSFKNCLNSSPSIYLTQFRMNRGAEQIILTDKTIQHIAKECGFASATYFSTKFGCVYGMTPTQYREENRLDQRQRNL